MISKNILLTILFMTISFPCFSQGHTTKNYDYKEFVHPSENPKKEVLHASSVKTHCYPDWNSNQDLNSINTENKKISGTTWETFKKFLCFFGVVIIWVFCYEYIPGFDGRYRA